MENFKKTIVFAKSGINVYDALTKSLDKWWTEMLEGVSNKQGQNLYSSFWDKCIQNYDS